MPTPEPGVPRCGTPRRAITGLTPVAQASGGMCRGRSRGRPEAFRAVCGADLPEPKTGGTCRRSSISWVTPLRFPPTSVTASGNALAVVADQAVPAARPYTANRAADASAPSGLDTGGAGHRPPPVQSLGYPQLQQHQVQLVLHADLVPCGQTPPAGHPGTEAPLLRQAPHRITVGRTNKIPHKARRSGTRGRTLHPPQHQLGQQRLDQRPPFIRHDPRPGLTLPHGRPTTIRTESHVIMQPGWGRPSESAE